MLPLTYTNHSLMLPGSTPLIECVALAITSHDMEKSSIATARSYFRFLSALQRFSPARGHIPAWFSTVECQRESLSESRLAFGDQQHGKLTGSIQQGTGYTELTTSRCCGVN